MEHPVEVEWKHNEHGNIVYAICYCETVKKYDVRFYGQPGEGVVRGSAMTDTLTSARELAEGLEPYPWSKRQAIKDIHSMQDRVVAMTEIMENIVNAHVAGKKPDVVGILSDAVRAYGLDRRDTTRWKVSDG